MAKRFIPNPRGVANQVNHIDGNKLNNNINNLEWVTQRENTIHSIDVLKQGTTPTTVYKDGVFIKSFDKRKDCYAFIAKDCNLSIGTVRKVLSGNRRTTNKILLRYRIE